MCWNVYGIRITWIIWVCHRGVEDRKLVLSTYRGVVIQMNKNEAINKIIRSTKIQNNDHHEGTYSYK